MVNGGIDKTERAERRYAEEDEMRETVTIRSRIDDLSNYTGYQTERIEKLTSMLEDILSPERPEVSTPEGIKEAIITTSDVEQRLAMIATRVDRNTHRLNRLMDRVNL